MEWFLLKKAADQEREDIPMPDLLRYVSRDVAEGEKMKLYEIADTYRAFMAAVDAGEIPEDAVADTLDWIEGEFEAKADSIACLIKELRLEAKGIKEEADTLAERARRAQTKADRLQSYLFTHMQAMGKSRITTSRNALSLRKGPVSCRIEDEDTVLGFLSMHHMEDCIKREVSIRKRELLARLKDGDEIPGAQIVQDMTITIK